MLTFSKTMALQDYDELKNEDVFIAGAREAVPTWHKDLHPHRLWEYCMALAAMGYVFGDVTDLSVSDWGYGTGFLSPLLLLKGHRVLMYETWQFGDECSFAKTQMEKAADYRRRTFGSYPPWAMLDADKVEDEQVDACFCLSTLEHVADYEMLYVRLLKSVRKGGLLFITTDFAEDSQDHYQNAGLRAGRMFTAQTYEGLLALALRQGFELIGDGADWSWSEDNRLVADYGFASLAVKRT